MNPSAAKTRKIKHRRIRKHDRSLGGIDIPVGPRSSYHRGMQVIPMNVECTPVTMTSSAGGIINNVLTISLSNAINVSYLPNTFDEFRIIDAELLYAPPAVNAGVNSLLYSDGIGLVDYDSSSALTSYGQAVNYDTARHIYLSREFKLNFLPFGQPDLEWQNASAPATVGWFKFYFTGLSVSSTYGRLYVRMRVQFRGVY